MKQVKVKILVTPDGKKVKAIFDTRMVGYEAMAGRRVKHYIYKDEELPCYWHESTYLSEYDEPETTYTRFVSETKFFGKYRLVKERVVFLTETWELIAQIIKTMES